MVKRAGAHSSDLQEQETPEQLCAKTKEAAEAWKPVSERIWNDPNDPMFEKRHDVTQGMAATDMTKFERLGRVRHPMPQDE